MATVRAIVRAQKKSQAVIYFRLTDGRDLKIYYKSELKVDPTYWDEKNQAIKVQKFNPLTPDERTKFKKDIADLTDIIFRVYNSQPDKAVKTSDWLQDAVNRILHPEHYETEIVKKQTFFDAWDEFLAKRKLSDERFKNYNVVIRAMKRFELYTAKITKQPFTLEFDTMNADTLRDFQKFLKIEDKISAEHPEIYTEVEGSRKKPEPRGANTLNGIFTKIRTFNIWSIDEGKTANNPFKNFEVEECVYGTPYYITIEERNKLYSKDMSDRPTLAVQRDIFVFQCLIGCRMGDLLKLTKQNVMNGAIEYIPRKSKDGRPITVRVPLNKIAKEILSRYEDTEGNKLLPFISAQKYNDAIKEAFTLAEITRVVTIINPTTREEEKQPLNKIASSHLARRCFVGNLYKQIKDPNLIGALSGHKEGSRAFARYWEIDEKMKIDLVNLLD